MNNKNLVIFSLLLLTASLLNAGTAGSVPDGFAVLAEKSGFKIKEPDKKTGNELNVNLNEDDLKRGFIATVADTMEKITPDRQWSEPFILNRIKIFGTRGEYRNFVIAVRALDDVSGLSYKVGDLRRGNLGVISGVNIDIRHIVAYEGDYRENNFLEKDFPFSIKSGNTAWIWGTVFIPNDTVPGSYSGTLELCGNGKTIALNLNVSVLDFELSNAGGNWGLFIPGHFSKNTEGCKSYCPDSWTKENLNLYFRFWKTLRLNSPVLCHVYPSLKLVNGEVVSSFPELSAFADSIKKNSLDGTVIIDTRFIEWWANAAAKKYENMKAAGKSVSGDIGINCGYARPETIGYSPLSLSLYEKVITQLLETAKMEKWPNVQFFPEEEMGNGGAVKPLGYEVFMPVLKKLAPDKAIVVDDDIGYGKANAIDRGSRDDIKCRIYNSWEHGALEKARLDGAEIRSYNYGLSRAAYGFLQQRLGSTGYYQWADQWPRWVYSIIVPGGIISSPELEQAREGRFDYDYCNTLKSYVAKLEKKGYKNEATLLKDKLTFILSKIPVSGPEFGRWRTKTTSRVLDDMRWAIAGEIQKARKFLHESSMIFPVISGNPCFSAITSRHLDSENAMHQNMLKVPYLRNSVSIDGELNEDCWNGNENSTGPLSWMKSKEIAMRAYASSEEEFREMPRPSYANASFAYNNKGLYIGVRSNHVSPETDKFSTHSDDDADLWKDNCMEFFFKLPDGEIYHLVVNTCGKKLFMRGSKVLNSSEIKVVVKGNVNTSGGSAQEIFIPWHIWGFGNVPNPNSSWLANVGREHHSFKQFTTWGKVYESFWETENWGMLTFSATSGIADIKPDEFCLFPGKSRVTGRIVSKEISNIATGEFLLNMKDASGKTVSSTILKSKGKSPEFCMEYFIPSLDKQEEWCLELKDNSGQELASLRFPISVFKNTIAINSIPDFIASGNSFPIDAMLCVGNLDISDSLLKAEFVSKDNGKVFAVREIVPSMNGECRIWVDSSGIPAGKYVFRIWLSRKSGEDAAFEKEMEVLPSY